MRKRDGVKKGSRFQSIAVRLTTFALAVSVFSLLFVGATLLRRMEGMTERELAQSYQWLVSEHVGNASNKLTLYDDCLEYIARNNAVQAALMEESGNPYVKGSAVSAEVFRMVPMENLKEVNNCLVYAAGPARVFGTRAKTFTEQDRAKWEKSGWQGGDACFVDALWSGQNVLALIKTIKYVDVTAFTARTIGYVRLNLYLEGLFRPPYDGERNYQLILTDVTGACVYESESGLSDSLGEGDFEVLKAEIPEYGLTLSYLFDNNELNGQKSAIRRQILTMTLAILLVVLLASRVYFTRFSRRVGQLLEKFRSAGSGDLSPKPPIGGSDEIAVLDQRFDQMLRDMDEMNRRDEAQKNAIREAKYRNLQLQINPHFLYNTLETISSIGAIHGVMQICDLCEKLGDIFRYSLGKNEGKYVAVSRELRQIQNYIFIQQVRHKFEAAYTVDIDADSVYMLRFLLQPIVENAVLHGLSRETGGRLLVRVSERDGALEIEIADNGAGMPEEKLEALRRSLTEGTDQRENNANIGLWNISQRIHLTCGEAYGIRVDSREGQGCQCTLRLPMITKDMIENGEEPSVDRG